MKTAKPSGTEDGLRRVARDPGLLLYNLATVFAAPVLLLMKVRLWATQGKKIYETRRWQASVTTPELNQELQGKPGVHVVFVGVSFGEWRLMDRIARGLEERIPDLKVTICLRDTITEGRVLEMQPDQNVAAWPYDFLIPTLRCLKALQPDVVVFTERFRFTNLSVGAARFGAKVAILNGRSRPRKGLYYKLAKPYYDWMFSAFAGFYMQNDRFTEAVRPFVHPGARVLTTGDLKFDLQRKEIPPEQERAIDEWLAAPGVPILAAGSTSDPEEELVVYEAYRMVRAKHDCRLLLAPRRIQRLPEVRKMLADADFTVCARSEGAARDADVYLLDTLGELAYAYKSSVAAYVGGSLHGMGHNVIEPVEWGIPVSYGPKRGHFEALQRLCEDASVGTRISNAQELAEHWMLVLEDSEFREGVRTRGRDLLDRQGQTFGRTVDALDDLIRQEPTTAAGRREAGIWQGAGTFPSDS